MRVLSRGPFVRAVAVCALASITLSSRLAGQNTDALCSGALSRLYSVDSAGNPCNALANALLEKVMHSRASATPTSPLSAISARDIQSRASGNAGELGIGSTTGVAGIQPTALGGISLSALGTGAGANSLLAISLNPLGLSAPAGDVTTVERSRVFDATLYLPAEPGDSAANGAPKYWGVRLRVNTAARGASAKLVEAGRTYAAVVASNAATATSLAQLLREAPRLQDCANAIHAGTAGTPQGLNACGQALPGSWSEQNDREFRKQVNSIRDTIDSKYFGADLRFEQGDPTLGAVESLSGRFINASLAGGFQLPGALQNETRLELRGRLGVQYLSVDSGSVVVEQTTGFATDAAIALQFTYPQEFRPLVAQVGIDMRSTGGLDETLTNALERGGGSLALSIELPLGPSNGVSISYLRPFRKEFSPRLTVSYNAQLLMSNALSAARP